jgi:hypothetical protein
MKSREAERSRRLKTAKALLRKATCKAVGDVESAAFKDKAHAIAAELEIPIEDLADQEDPVFWNTIVIELRYKRYHPHLKLAAGILRNHFQMTLKASCQPGCKWKVSFARKKPKSPKFASELFMQITAHMEAEWKTQLVRMREFKRVAIKIHKASFMSGLAHGIAFMIARVREEDPSMGADEDESPDEPEPALIEEPDPFVAAPNNPFALQEVESDEAEDDDEPDETEPDEPGPESKPEDEQQPEPDEVSWRLGCQKGMEFKS